MTNHDFDLFVIGGGSGGVRTARMAAKAGARVAIAEEYRYGGTCVIRGCVPKKLLVYASHYHEDFEDRQASFFVDAPEQVLRDNPLQGFGQGGANLCLLIGREHVDNTVNGFGGALRVQGSENKVTGGCGFQGQSDGFQIPHFTDQDDVRIFA